MDLSFKMKRNLTTGSIVFSLLLTLGILFIGKAYLYSGDIPDKSNYARYSLEGQWEFRSINETRWYKAKVPGCVHTDLMDNGLIPDPYFRDNETRVQGIEREDWEYKRMFEVTKDVMCRGHIELVCKGLDTYATIFLNNEKIANTENMFREYRFNIKPYLKTGQNDMRVRFESPVRHARILEEKLPYKLPGGCPHVRKAPYHFGWDWGPRLVTSGIWRPIYIESWDKARIEDIEIIQEFHGRNKVSLHLKLSLLSDISEKIGVSIKVSGRKTYTKYESFCLQQGMNSKEIIIDIMNPDLWWPARMGDQNLYTVDVHLFYEKQLLDFVSKRIGIRSLVLKQEKDQWGRSFKFVVNGIPFFAKGGNWIPADMFPNRVSPKKYERILKDCVEANMNMLRVWGGGIYEAPEFYDLCDELGITLWQDFMFACAMYPGDDAFLENVREEAKYVIKELRHHPSIALWCGNNECEEGWFHWGWKEHFPDSVWKDYEKIFHQILPKAVEKYDSRRQYWPSSPHSEKVGEPRSEESGDMHYWGIWHGREPFKEYRKKFHRFMSEFGFQSFPLIETVKTFTIPGDWNISSPIMEYHQKSSQGNKLILHYMLDHYRLPKDFESILWVSQVLQAEGMKLAVEHFRSQMPRVMGSLYWQINNCWQVASWSGIDYLGRWKALHYYAKRFYSPVLVVPVDNGKVLNVYCISDLRRSVDAEFRWSVYTYGGKLIQNHMSEMKIEPSKSRIILTKPLDEMKKNFNDIDVYFYCEITWQNKILSSNIYHFSPLKKVSLIHPQIDRKVSFENENVIIYLESKHFAKDVYLSVPFYKGRFSDNFFDMIPEKKYRIDFLTDEKIDIKRFEENLKIMTLRDTY